MMTEYLSRKQAEKSSAHLTDIVVRWKNGDAIFKSLVGMPEEVFCANCSPRWVHDDVLINMRCTCSGTWREPIPFTEVWGI